MDRLTQIRAGWHIAWAGRSLEARIQLILFLHKLYGDLSKEMQEQAAKAGELESLKALDKVLEEKMKNV